MNQFTSDFKGNPYINKQIGADFPIQNVFVFNSVKIEEDNISNKSNLPLTSTEILIYSNKLEHTFRSRMTKSSIQ